VLIMVGGLQSACHLLALLMFLVCVLLPDVSSVLFDTAAAAAVIVVALSMCTKTMVTNS